MEVEKTVSDLDFLNALANLNEEDYTEIGRRIFELLDEYYEMFQDGTEKNAA